MTVGGKRFAGVVPSTFAGGGLYMFVPAGTVAVTVDDMRAERVTAALARRLLAGGG